MNNKFSKSKIKKIQKNQMLKRKLNTPKLNRNLLIILIDF